MDYEPIRAGLAQAIPFNSHLGLEVVEVGPGTGVVRLPDDDRLRNHVGTQHAGGVFAEAG
jgi:acyl-coenzyme A thioesterase PaaI-like protein